MEIKELKIDKVPENGVIRVVSVNGIDEKEPKKLDDISGAINTPYEFLQKRHSDPSVNLDMSHIVFNYEKHFIELVLNEDSHYYNKVIGKMIKTEVLQNISINTGKRWDAFDLADFFRLNRSIFLDKSESLKLVALLNNFKAKVDKELEQSKDNRANYNLQKRQVVESNLPDAFKLLLPIFKGQGKVEIDVEVDIDPVSLECVLISPQLAEIMQTEIESIINSQLELIKTLCSKLPIIEV